MPEGFEGYCRIFHPVATGDATRSRSWSEVARENGRVVHPAMQFHDINRPVGVPLPPTYQPGAELSWGSCPLPVRRALVALLAESTTTPESCWFCVWEGFGGFGNPSVPRLRLPQRDYLVYQGPIDQALESPDPRMDQSPNLWWPDDRAWIVATEVDFAWTYVGGKRSLARAVLLSEQFEALPVELTDKPFFDSDTVNQQLDRG